MLPTMRANLLVLLCFAAPALAQRPKSAAEAIERFEQQRDRTEAERQRAAGDLGDFADAAVTTLLLAELQRAEGFGYRQTIVKALGERPREGVVEPLAKLLAASTAARASENLAAALCKQGDAGIAELAKQLTTDAGQRRNAICDALGRTDHELARRTLLGEQQRGDRGIGEVAEIAGSALTFGFRTVALLLEPFDRLGRGLRSLRQGRSGEAKKHE
jgi:HEAT repeat protein